jgi:hypothetical protein
MPKQDDPSRPLPSAAEINAYLELSAARTKKRLTLAFGTPGAKAAARDRKLPVAGPPKPEPTADTTLPKASPTDPSKTKP